MKPVNDDINTERTENAICPYCGHVHLHSWSWGSSGYEFDEDNTECNYCGKIFHWERNVTVSYTTHQTFDGGGEE